MQCQALARKWLSRREFEQVQQIHRSTFFQSNVNHLQARVRGVLCRRELENKRITFETCSEEWAIQLQTASRGFLARLKLQRLLNADDDDDDDVQQVGFTTNSIVHNVQKELGRYPTSRQQVHETHTLSFLVSQKNPSVGTVKNFIHLLDDSDLDYNSELKLESIRQEVIQSIRDNSQLDAHVNTIDTKIALLVQNAITIDEVLKVTGPLRKKEQQRRFNQLAAAAEAEATSQGATPFTFRNINQKNQNALDLYQQLVYLLQTEPSHLSKLVSLTGVQDFGGDGDGHKRIEATILALFGYATNAREEYLLINLCRVRQRNGISST